MGAGLSGEPVVDGAEALRDAGLEVSHRDGAPGHERGALALLVGVGLPDPVQAGVDLGGAGPGVVGLGRQDGFADAARADDGQAGLDRGPTQRLHLGGVQVAEGARRIEARREGVGVVVDVLGAGGGEAKGGGGEGDAQHGSLLHG